MTHDIRRVRCRLRRPVPDAASQRPSLPVFGGTVGVGLAQQVAERIQQIGLAARIAQRQPSVTRIERRETLRLQDSAIGKGVVVLSGRAGLEREAYQMEFRRVRVVQFDELVGVVIAGAVRVRQQLGNLRCTQPYICYGQHRNIGAVSQHHRRPR